jgi:endonuclease YncB( thermonuclease family)
MNKRYTIELETADDGSGDLVLPLSDEIMTEAGWSIGDTIEWVDNNNGTWTLRKKQIDSESK